MNWITYDLVGLIGLVILGPVIIFVIRLVLILFPAGVIAFAVWWFTGSTMWAGIAFLIVAALSILKKL